MISVHYTVLHNVGHRVWWEHIFHRHFFSVVLHFDSRNLTRSKKRGQGNFLPLPRLKNSCYVVVNTWELSLWHCSIKQGLCNTLIWQTEGKTSGGIIFFNNLCKFPVDLILWNKCSYFTCLENSEYSKGPQIFCQKDLLVYQLFVYSMVRAFTLS